MKIATNVVLSAPDGCEVVPLDDPGLRDVDAVVLVLGQAFSSSGAAVLDRIVEQVERLPETVGCYVLGVETAVPNRDFIRFRSPERDQRVSRFVSAVLKRSNVIGVRGDLTREWLMEEFNIPSVRIEVVFRAEKSAEDNGDAMLHTMRRNEIPFSLNLAELQRLQHFQAPYSVAFDPNILIGQPYIVDNGNESMLCADVRIDGVSKTWWVKTESQWRDYLLVERSDAFIVATLPLAIRTHRDIVCEAPVSEIFAHNLAEVLIPTLAEHNPGIYRSKIIATTDNSPLPCGEARGVGMSCGVDSFRALQEYIDPAYPSLKATHIFTGNYLYEGVGKATINARSAAVAAELGLNFVVTETNISSILSDIRHDTIHFFKTMFNVFAVRKLWRSYVYASTYDYSQFTFDNIFVVPTPKYELLLINTFSTPDFHILDGGATMDRPAKVKAISSFPITYKYLNVCLNPAEPTNCSQCSKCIRTLLNLDMAGTLDLYRDSFDVDGFLAHRNEHMKYLVEHKTHIYFSAMYRHYRESEPELIATLEQKLRVGAPGDSVGNSTAKGVATLVRDAYSRMIRRLRSVRRSTGI
jgi:hypothetical protein